jgi:hypothetical protein
VLLTLAQLTFQLGASQVTKVVLLTADSLPSSSVCADELYVPDQEHRGGVYFSGVTVSARSVRRRHSLLFICFVN